MSYRTFQWFCKSLRPFISKAETRSDSLCLWSRKWSVFRFLGTTSEYGTIAQLFGISRASPCFFVQDVCEAICNHLTPESVKLPTDREAINIMESFKEKWGHPAYIGAIDGSPTVAPKESLVD